ncbi:MAG: hypothetical protein L3J47_08400 [Sulfurovum sp.]|nr:hypothetical protein [Sulfurovum sp.]
MDWLSVVKIVGMFLTVVFVGFLLKELIKSARDSKNGKVSGKCELD